jgi:hypothetical protein
MKLHLGHELRLFYKAFSCAVFLSWPALKKKLCFYPGADLKKYFPPSALAPRAQRAPASRTKSLPQATAL